MRITQRPVEQLLSDPRNVRLHSERNISAVMASLQSYGQQKPIVVDDSGKVLAGNGTLDAARRLGWAKIATVTSTLKGVDATGYAIADNRTAELALWDEDLLAQQLAELGDASIDLDALGWTDDELSELGATWSPVDFDDKPIKGPAAGTGWALKDSTWCVHHGDNRQVLETIETGSIDAVVTDPPYELNFMSKGWDNRGIAYDVELWRQLLRVLKPGGHLVAFGGTRTSHRMVCAIEDAGFEIRDSLCWLYGSGFPKSLDVSKAIDKAAGVELDITAPATAEAKRWQGWGTALKPAHEPIVLARKPIEGTVADNVKEHGTGALNIDATRIGEGGDKGVWPVTGRDKTRHVLASFNEHAETDNTQGRWPANVVLDEQAGELLDEQAGELTSGAVPAGMKRGGKRTTYQDDAAGADVPMPYDKASDSGGASRFFYCAKASTSEREHGLDHISKGVINAATPPGSKGSNSPRAGAGRTGPRSNIHPTVKPVELMRWLIKLITPPGGTVLDPFTGSGTTGIAARCEGTDFVGIEQSAEYVELARARIGQASSTEAGDT